MEESVDEGENDDHNVHSDRDHIHRDDTEGCVHHGKNDVEAVGEKDDHNVHDPDAPRGRYNLRTGERVQYGKGVRDKRVRRGKRSGIGGCSSVHPVAQEEFIMPSFVPQAWNVLEFITAPNNVFEFNTRFAKCVKDAISFMKQFISSSHPAY